MNKLKFSSLLLGTAFAGSMILAGCGTGGGQADQPNSGKGKNNPTGLYREVGNWTLPPQYQGNPYGSGGIGSAYTFTQQGLFQFVRFTDKVYNRLAESVDSSQPGKTIVHIRKDAKWNDGQPFTSKDVWAYYTLNNGTELTDYLTSIDTPDDYTVVFNWSNPAPFNEMKQLFLAEDYQDQIPYHVYKQYVDKAAAILAAAPVDTDPADQGKQPFQRKLSNAQQKAMNDNWQAFSRDNPKLPIGTGPYKVTKVTATDMLLDKNPFFYDASKVKFKTIDLKQVSDLSQQYALLKAGQLDRYDGTQPKDILESILTANKNLVHYQMFDPACVGFIFNTAHKPFDNQTFRQAVTYALDRNKIRDVGNYYGHTTDFSTTGMPPSIVSQYVTPDVLAKFTKYTHDEQKAAQLLQSIGWKKGSDGIWKDANGKSHNFVIASDQGWVPAVNSGEVVAEQLTAFGLPTKYKAVDSGIYWGNVDNKDGSYDMSFDWVDVSWGFNFPWNPMRNFWWQNTYRHAHMAADPKMGGAAYTAKGYDGKDVNPNALLHQIPYMPSEADRQHAIEQIAYVTNEGAFAVDLFQNVTGTWYNMQTIAGVPWQSAVAKYNRDVPVPPADQEERIRETNEGQGGIMWMIDGTYSPN